MVVIGQTGDATVKDTPLSYIAFVIFIEYGGNIRWSYEYLAGDTVSNPQITGLKFIWGGSRILTTCYYWGPLNVNVIVVQNSLDGTIVF